MKIGYKGNYDKGVYAYINNKKSNICFKRTCYASFKIYKDDVMVSEQYTIEQTYNKVKELILNK